MTIFLDREAVTLVDQMRIRIAGEWFFNEPRDRKPSGQPGRPRSRLLQIGPKDGLVHASLLRRATRPIGPMAAGPAREDFPASVPATRAGP